MIYIADVGSRQLTHIPLRAYKAYVHVGGGFNDDGTLTEVSLLILK